MITRNTDWLAANLKKFGCEYVQIDDGWQGVGNGDGENRDWYVTDPRKFPHGMKWLADYIRAKGFTPGIWVIPFTTSDEKFFHQHPELFLRRADGTSAFETRNPKTGKVEFNWAGRYAIDATTPQGRKWIANLFNMLCSDWGYDYVKIDGQGDWQMSATTATGRPIRSFAHGCLPPGPGCGQVADEAESIPAELRRPSSSCGYCEGMRIGGDVGTQWSGVMTAMQATMGSLYLNNICFWTDPDVVCVRQPLTLEQARFWATLLGITGQLLMASDDMPALPEERVELLRRIFPVADIRPMDLYPLQLAGWPRIFDLRVSLPKVGQWDVVAMFNRDPLKTVSIRLDPKDLGLAADPYIFYDAWRKELLGVGSDGLTLALGPMSCRLLVVRRQTDGPQLVGSSRHITQGADDLLEATWDPSPQLGPAVAAWWAAIPTSCDSRSRHTGTAPMPACRPGLSGTPYLRSKESQTMPWRIAFWKARGSEDPRPISIENAVQNGEMFSIKWQGEGAIAYRVYRDGKLLGQTTETRFSDRVRGSGPGIHRYTVSALGLGFRRAAGSGRRDQYRAAAAWNGQGRLARRVDAHECDARRRRAAKETQSGGQAAYCRRQSLCPGIGRPCSQRGSLPTRQPIPTARCRGGRGRRKGRRRLRRVSSVCRRPKSLR